MLEGGRRREWKRTQGYWTIPNGARLSLMEEETFVTMPKSIG